MEILFLIFAGIAVASALNVILQRNPIYSAIGLIITLCALAGLFLTLSAQFIAAIQIIVYAGAIMVLFVFVIMLLNVRTEEARPDRHRIFKWIAVPLFLALLAEVYYVVRTVSNPPPVIPETGGAPPAEILGTVQSIGNQMFTSYLLPFEATSVLILMAIVGAMLLARRDKVAADPAGEASPAVVTEPMIGEHAVESGSPIAAQVQREAE
jgi:NADH-quinone oxidoreductase subunit J